MSATGDDYFDMELFLEWSRKFGPDFAQCLSLYVDEVGIGGLLETLIYKLSDEETRQGILGSLEDLKTAEGLQALAPDTIGPYLTRREVYRQLYDLLTSDEEAMDRAVMAAESVVARIARYFLDSGINPDGDCQEIVQSAAGDISIAAVITCSYPKAPRTQQSFSFFLSRLDCWRQGVVVEVPLNNIIVVS